MQIKDIEKIQRIYLKIKELDEEILKLDKLALEIANDDCKISINVENFTKQQQEEAKEKAKFDEDGSLTSGLNLYNSLFTWPSSISSSTIKVTTTNDFTVNDITALNILGFILQGLHSKREILLRELDKYKIER